MAGQNQARECGLQVWPGGSGAGRMEAGSRSSVCCWSSGALEGPVPQLGLLCHLPGLRVRLQLNSAEAKLRPREVRDFPSATQQGGSSPAGDGRGRLPSLTSALPGEAGGGLGSEPPRPRDQAASSD